MLVYSLGHNITPMSTPKKTNPSIKNARRAERVPTSVSVTMNGKKVLTRNVSATGVYLSIKGDKEVGEPIDFSVDLEADGDNVRMNFQGEVVRVDHNGTETGVAAKILNSSFDLSGDKS